MVLVQRVGLEGIYGKNKKEEKREEEIILLRNSHLSAYIRDKSKLSIPLPSPILNSLMIENAKSDRS
jgi:hypothetical protein